MRQRRCSLPSTKPSMSNTTSPMAEFNLGPNYGPILIGALLEAALWGMTTVQTVVYFINYGSKDRWDVKTVVREFLPDPCWSDFQSTVV